MPLAPLPEPTSRLARLKGLVLGSIASAFLFSTLIGFNVLQTASLVIKLFSPRAFRRVNQRMARIWWGWCALGAEKVYGTRWIMSGDDVPPKENAIVVLNHQEMADITVVFSFARAKGRVGDLKWFVKDVLKYVPGVGWGMLFLDCPFIKRDWTADKDYIHRVFRNILKNDVPLWLMTFAEGTRVRPEKIVKSQTYAREQGMTPLEHVLIPRTKGFVASVQSLRGHVDAVYDLTIGYVGGVPTLWQWIKGYVRKVHMNVRRFAINAMPEDGQALSDWLIRRFEEKDRLLDYFYANQVFPAVPSLPADRVLATECVGSGSV
jgi:1-acyl-sn-glycerol-3-phosphate acyltransferase